MFTLACNKSSFDIGVCVCVNVFRVCILETIFIVKSQVRMSDIGTNQRKAFKSKLFHLIFDIQDSTVNASDKWPTSLPLLCH